jgi:hypothetical protein
MLLSEKIINVTANLLLVYAESVITVKNLFFWLPRILSMVFIAFISIFALDVFSEYRGFEAILPFLIHLIPSLILLLATVIAWKYDLVGAVIYLGFGAFYVWSMGFEKPLSWYLVIALPSAVIGLMYFINWLLSSGRKSKSPTVHQ